MPIALYPQREALGEEEPHYEIAGERVETIAALLEGRLRILVTTARATLERTRVPASLAQKTLRLRTGTTDGGKAGSGTLTETATALEAMGYRRVPTVTEVAEFSVRGGIIDVYGFGMAAPARLEWWGDQLDSIRSFDLTSQRSGEGVEEITILPMAGATGESRLSETNSQPLAEQRQSLLELLPAGTLVIEEASGAE